MSVKQAYQTNLRVLLAGLGFGESPRWHHDRLWFANWGMEQIVAVDLGGNSEVMARIHTTLPYCFDWRPDGRMLIVSGPEGLVLRMEPDESFATHVDLTSFSPSIWNESIVDSRGTAYINGNGIVSVTSDGRFRQEAADLAFPNGMAITRGNSTLIIAECHAHRLTAFDIKTDGSLSHRRV